VCLCGVGREKREKVTLPGLRSRWEMDEMAREQHRDAKRLATFFQYTLSPLLSLSCFLFWNKKSPTIQGFNQTSCQYLLVGCCPHGSLHLLIEDHTYESTEKTPPNNTLEGNTMIISVVITYESCSPSFGPHLQTPAPCSLWTVVISSHDSPTDFISDCRKMGRDNYLILHPKFQAHWYTNMSILILWYIFRSSFGKSKLWHRLGGLKKNGQRSMLLYQDKRPRHGNVQSTWHFEVKQGGGGGCSSDTHVGCCSFPPLKFLFDSILIAMSRQ
jgi:hypothetical protein